MRRRAFLAAAMAPVLLAAGRRETELSDPKPSIDVPRRIVVSISERDPDRANAIFSNIINIQAFYGQDLVEIVVVGYGPGVRHLIREESQVAERVASLQAYGIEFLACGATLETLGLGDEAALDGVEVVQNGLPEIVERQLRGWVHLRP
jgi:intracellular sulfur oxidation DsrE/DsrF family protein